MKNFLRAVAANKWEMFGLILTIAGAECFRMAGIRAKEDSDVWKEANKITKETSGD